MIENGYRIAADIGGTFTDIALLTDDGGVATCKIPSTPDDYSTAVVEGIKSLSRQISLPLGEVAEVLHGCTVATNAILERKGARTAVVTTKGFRDVLELRRIRMPRLYDPLYVKPEPLAPRRDCLEVAERIAADGEVIAPIDIDDVMGAVEHIRRHDIEAVAVVFLHSYANPAHEVLAGEILRRELPDCFVSTSVEILPEIREYERTSTTVINAYVGPPVRRYVQALSRRLGAGGHLRAAAGDAVERRDAGSQCGRGPSGTDRGMRASGGRRGCRAPGRHRRLSQPDNARHGRHDRKGLDHRERPNGQDRRVRGRWRRVAE